jgi:hypothetical protein
MSDYCKRRLRLRNSFSTFNINNIWLYIGFQKPVFICLSTYSSKGIPRLRASGLFHRDGCSFERRNDSVHENIFVVSDNIKETTNLLFQLFHLSNPCANSTPERLLFLGATRVWGGVPSPALVPLSTPEPCCSSSSMHSRRKLKPSNMALHIGGGIVT